MTDSEPVVFLICDKSKTRRQFAMRLKQLGYDAQPYNSADEFQKRSFATEPGACCSSSPTPTASSSG